MVPEDYDEVRALWMTIRGFGIRALDDSREDIERIIDIELKGLFRRINDMGYTVELSDEAKQFVAEKGYDVQFGARPLKRAIQTYIEDGISEMIVNEDLSDGTTIVIDKAADKEELSFTIKTETV